MKENTNSADRIAGVLSKVAASFGAPAQDTILFENFGKHFFELGLLLKAQGATGEHARILDIGGGMGVNLLCLRELCGTGIELHLVDRFEEYSDDNKMGPARLGQRLMQQAHISVENTDFSEAPVLPYPPGFFDVVTILDVIEHLPGHPIRLMKGIQTILKPGATIVVSGPNAVSLMKRLKLLVGKQPYAPFEDWCADSYYGHFREYTPNEYQSLLERAGFVDAEVILVAEPSRTRARHHYHKVKHGILSPVTWALYAVCVIDALIPNLRPAVYCIAKNPYASRIHRLTDSSTNSDTL